MTSEYFDVRGKARRNANQAYGVHSMEISSSRCIALIRSKLCTEETRDYVPPPSLLLFGLIQDQVP